VDDALVTEGHNGVRILTFTIRLSRAMPGTVGVRFATADGSATAGSDFVEHASKVYVPTGSLSQPVLIAIHGDVVEEADEWFMLRLSNPDPGLVIGDAIGRAEIINDDFSDPDLAGLLVRARHITSLRGTVNRVRAAAGLASFAFTDALVPFATPVKAVHITELRTALTDAYRAVYRTAPPFVDTPLIAGETPLRALHLAELREAVAAFTADGDHIIRFAQAGPMGTPLPVYQEAGFTMHPTAGSWEAGLGNGSPYGTVVQFRAVRNQTVVGQLHVADGGQLFRFASIDLYSSVTEIPFVITGRRAGATVFEQQGTVGHTSGGRARVRSNYPVTEIDTLVIRMTNDPGACCGNPMGLTNIALNGRTSAP